MMANVVRLKITFLALETVHTEEHLSGCMTAKYRSMVNETK